VYPISISGEQNCYNFFGIVSTIVGIIFLNSFIVIISWMTEEQGRLISIIMSLVC